MPIAGRTRHIHCMISKSFLRRIPESELTLFNIFQNLSLALINIYPSKIYIFPLGLYIDFYTIDRIPSVRKINLTFSRNLFPKSANRVPSRSTKRTLSTFLSSARSKRNKAVWISKRHSDKLIRLRASEADNGCKSVSLYGSRVNLHSISACRTFS